MFGQTPPGRAIRPGRVCVVRTQHVCWQRVPEISKPSGAGTTQLITMQQLDDAAAAAGNSEWGNCLTAGR